MKGLKSKKKDKAKRAKTVCKVDLVVEMKLCGPHRAHLPGALVEEEDAAIWGVQATPVDATGVQARDGCQDGLAVLSKVDIGDIAVLE